MNQSAKTAKTKFVQSVAIVLIAGLALIVGSIATAYIYVQTQQSRYPNSSVSQLCSSQVPQILYENNSGVLSIWVITISCSSTSDSPTQIIAWFDGQKFANSSLFISTQKSSRYSESYGQAPARLTVMHMLTTIAQQSQTHIFITTGYQLDLGIKHHTP
jgi:hypothetical protein